MVYRRSCDPDIVGTKLCECGCGSVIVARNQNGPIKYKHGHVPAKTRKLPKHKDHYNWQGGKIKMTKDNGYIMIRSEDHPRASKRGKYVLEHILIMEKYLGRYLEPNEIVHHKNGIKYDNRLVNLELLTDNTHKSLHANHRIRDHGKFTMSEM